MFTHSVSPSFKESFKRILIWESKNKLNHILSQFSVTLSHFCSNFPYNINSFTLCRFLEYFLEQASRKKTTRFYTQIMVKNSFCFNRHFGKSVRIRSLSVPYFPAFGVNMESLYSFCIQSKCREIPTRKTPHTDTFHSVRNSFQDVYSFQFRYLQCSIAQENIGKIFRVDSENKA